MASIFPHEYKVLLQRLQTARKEAELSQAKVSKMLNRPQSFVSKVESGERRIDPVELEALSKIYKKRLSYFLYKNSPHKS